MDIKKIQAEVDKVGKSTFAKKTDKQLLSYEILSELHKRKNKESQPNSLIRYNSRIERQCKLTLNQIAEIIKKYNPHIHGKYLLAKEYGVSPNTIYKVIKKYL
jgi:Mor family transcriptional regulator